MTWKNNHWVKFLEGYCKGKNQIQDEYVRKVAKRLGIDEPLDIKFPWQQEILSKFQSNGNHNLIILTGTAGDGKTKLCRDIVRALDGDDFDEDVWNENSYFSTDERTVVKDFSELKDDKNLLIRELLTILDTKHVPKPILVAVNDGILVEELENFIKNSSDEAEQDTAKLLKEIIEDKINLGFSECEGQDLVNLINLSKLNAKENMALIFDTILDHPGWSHCDGCAGKENQSCAIYSKYHLLKNEPHIKENLSNIILLLQLNNEHFTIRELLNLATNTLLASVPKPKALRIADMDAGVGTLNCTSIPKIEHTAVYASESSIEVGFWGMNLGAHKMRNNRPFSEINKLGFGELSTNYWDRLLRHKTERDFTIPLDVNNKLFGARRIDGAEGSGRDSLFIPEKGQGSITPISIFHGEDIRERDIVIRSIKNDMSLSGARIEPVLILEIDRKHEVKMSLTVELFDYLAHVSKGAPPNTTDPRLYKKLLILRSKLSTLTRENRRTETYSIQNGEFRQVILEVQNG